MRTLPRIKLVIINGMTSTIATTTTQVNQISIHLQRLLKNLRVTTSCLRTRAQLMSTRLRDKLRGIPA